MAVAGRILIMPKGSYDASVTYEMLDMVSHNNQTWLAKRTNVGIEPSEANSEYWFNMVGISSADLEANKVEILAEVDQKIVTSKEEVLAEVEQKNNASNAEIAGVKASLADYLKKSGGEMTGVLKAVNPSASVEGVRNITAGTSDLTAGTSALATGSIYIVYE